MRAAIYALLYSLFLPAEFILHTYDCQVLPDFVGGLYGGAFFVGIDVEVVAPVVAHVEIERVGGIEFPFQPHCRLHGGDVVM